jgi:hypothetical protein
MPRVEALCRAPNKQLHRTVTRRHVHRAARRRRTRALARQSTVGAGLVPTTDVGSVRRRRALRRLDEFGERLPLVSTLLGFCTPV